jgi:predicted aconitase with swiveling domain
MEKHVKGRILVAGQADGSAVVTEQPISFWGGINPKTGDVIDRRHELCGRNITGKIFVFPIGKGSSTASAILLEGIRNGSAPAAIINKRVDPILALGAIVAEEMYHRTIPVIVLEETAFLSIHDGDHLRIGTDGTVIIDRNVSEVSL